MGSHGGRSRLRVAAGAGLGAAVAAGAFPAAASAHGLVGKTNLPVPQEVFIAASSGVLIISFLALAALWQQPKLETDRWRALPGWIGRVLTSLPVQLLTGAFGVFLLGVVVWSGFEGTQTGTANFATNFVYVIFWVGLVPVSVLFGDVFRAFNPWRAVGRAVAWVARLVARRDLPAPLEYPEWLGRWPAAVGIVAFAWMELVAPSGDLPQSVAEATLIYSALTFVAMALFGVEQWCERGEAFSVYYNLFSRISPVELRGRTLGLRLPGRGLVALPPATGTVGLLAAMIGSTTFDGLGSAPFWSNFAADFSRQLETSGLSVDLAINITFGLGLLVTVGLVYGFYTLGIIGVKSVGGPYTTQQLANRFIHSLVPIALVYVGAHYLTFLLWQGQAIYALASNPLGHGTDYFGTAGNTIDYGVIGATTTWYWQVGLVVCGHVGALCLAHDRALAMYDDPKQAIRSQYWMLAIMIGFTTLALWLLSQA